MLESIQKKHAKEKEAAGQELEAYQAACTQQLQTLTAQYTGKVVELKTEIGAMNSRFAEKIVAFEALTQTLRADLNEARKVSSSDIDALKRTHESELQDLVRSNNEKYNAQTVAHLKAIEEAEAAANKRVQEAREAACREMQEELERKLAALRSSLEQEKQEALAKLREELEGTLEKQRAEAAESIGKVQLDLKNKSTEYSVLLKEKQELAEELNRKLRELQSSITSQASDAGNRIKELSSELNCKMAEIAALKSALQERNEDVERLQANVAANLDSISALENTAEAHKKLIEDLKEQLALMNKEGATVEATLRNKISILERDVISMTEDISKNGQLLLSAREEVKRLEAAAKASAVDHAKAIDELRKENESLNKRLQDAQSSSKSAEDNLAKEVTLLRRQLSDLDTASKKEISELKAKHASDMETMNRSHEAALSAAQKALLEATNRASLNEASLKQELERVELGYKQQLSQLTADHQSAIDQLMAEHNAAIEALKATIASLEQQLQDLSTNADGEKGVLKAEVTKYQERSRALQKELDARKKEGERIDSVCTSLKNQVESLREELKASQQAYREKMDSSLAKLDEEWQSKLEAAQKDHEARLALEAEAAERRLQEQLEELRRAHLEEVSVLKGALKKEAADASQELVRVEMERLQLEELLNTTKGKYEDMLFELAQKHKQELQDAEDRRRKEVDRLQRELSASAESSQKAIVDEYELKLADLKALMEKRLEDLAGRHMLEQERLKDEATETLQVKLQDLESRLNIEKSNALAAAAARHSVELAKLQEERDQAISELNAKIKSLDQSLTGSKEEVRSLNQQMDAEKQERAMREAQMQSERDQLQRDCQTEIRREKERSQRALIEAGERAASEIKAIQQQFGAEKMQLEDALRRLEQNMAALMAKYNSRESRQEDLDMIEALRREMIEKDQLVAQTREEMLYFKREMLNREENYNKKFNSTPNVGVMNVIKTKEEKTAPGGKKPPAQFRPLNPPPGSGAMGLGAGGGVGGIATSSSAGGMGIGGIGSASFGGPASGGPARK
jgi:hypothetical protein